MFLSKRSCFAFHTFMFSFLLLAAANAHAQVNRDEDTSFRVRSIFGEKFKPQSFFSSAKYRKVVDLGSADREIERRLNAAQTNDTPAPVETISQPESAAEKARAKAMQDRAYIFTDENPLDNLRSPDADPRLRVNREAPPEFVGMIDAGESGDQATAKAYARAFVRYNVNLMFKLREYTRLIGEALIDEQVIEEDDWEGVEQYIDIKMAETRDETGALLKPKHEHALAQVKPTTDGKVEVFWFFSPGSYYSREMAPDVERLWHVAKSDPKIKLVALSIEEVSVERLRAFQEHVELSAPMYNGDEVKKTFNVAFAPTLVVASPTDGTAYRRTGKQSFQHMYELVRTVQGQPITLDKKAEKLLRVPIGKAEKLQAKKDGIVFSDSRAASSELKVLKQVEPKETVKRF